MSILRSLKQLFDPIEYRREVKEQKRKTETRAAEGQGDGPRRAPQRWRCRLCAHEDDGPYCLRCLAETMERLRPR